MLLRILFYLCVFTLSLGQFAGILSIGDSNLYLFDLMVGFFAFSGLVYFLTIKRFFKLPKYLIGFLIFTVIAGLSLVLAIPNLSDLAFFASASYLVRWVTYLVAAMILFNMVEMGLISQKQIVFTFLYSGFFLSLAGFVQLAILPDFETMDASLGWDPHKNRLASTFFDPNFVGGYLVLCLGILLGSEKWFKDVWILLVGITMTVALFLTFSRSSWAMFAVVIFVFGLFKYKKLLLLSLLIGFLAYFAVPRVQTRISGVTDPADSAHFRLISWKNTWEIAKDNLLTGVGFNTFRYAQKEYGVFEVGSVGGHSGAGSDSSFLLVLATTGILGFLVFGLSYIHPVFSRKKLVLTALLGGLFVHSQFVNSLFYPQIMFLWLSFLANCFSFHN